MRRFPGKCNANYLSLRLGPPWVCFHLADSPISGMLLQVCNFPAGTASPCGFACQFNSWVTMQMDPFFRVELTQIARLSTESSLDAQSGAEAQGELYESTCLRE
jgi:hypothetical protein